MPISSRTMPARAIRTDDFGPRLKALRVERGWTQHQLAEMIGGTLRSINYYETGDKYPPANVVADLAEAFSISMEALMGRAELSRQKRHKDEPDLLNDPEDRRLWKKFRQLRQLTERQQQRVLGMVNDLVT